MSTKRGILRTGLCLLAALFGLAGFLYFYWQSLPDRSTPLRVAIPNSQLTPGDGFAVRWEIPPEIRKYRWRRTPVRLLESGKPLPFRTELSALVATNGGGRFFARDAELWFS